jgi:hypothetical protein
MRQLFRKTEKEEECLPLSASKPARFATSAGVIIAGTVRKAAVVELSSGGVLLSSSDPFPSSGKFSYSSIGQRYSITPACFAW